MMGWDVGLSQGCLWLSYFWMVGSFAEIEGGDLENWAFWGNRQRGLFNKR